MSAKGGVARKSDKRKQSLYFPEDMLQEIIAEAARLDRSLSWIMQRAWQAARKDIRKIPSVNDYLEPLSDDEDEDDENEDDENEDDDFSGDDEENDDGGEE